ncbi:hypothetical protein BJF89_01015 [Corynebacterium sp. CNJ-954]|uniref:phage portal protein family protein n=1 Tax=Corynebacterium sp. CNJ-954 TaxID=1904962 RepID=UPI00096541B2|nr:DUF935 family protein [Corynebacterium sp. CNJ-954]OLT54844.1 hypothetical protein BJF89_01015 [Corynebacterium sp. CNJ-954]
MTEQGHAVYDETSVVAESNWELRYPFSLRPYSRMGREDSQVRSVLKAVKLPIQRTTWRLDPHGADEEIVRQVAEDLRLPIIGDDAFDPSERTGGHASWSKHLHWVLKQLDFGHAFFEAVYKTDETTGRDRLHKIAYRPPETITKINVADDGGLESIEQSAPAGRKNNGRPIVLPVSNLLAYVHDPEDTSWTGSSVLRAAYKHWVLKDTFMRLEANVLDRNGMGIPTITASSAEDPHEVDENAKLAASIRSGKTAGLSLKNGAKAELMGVSGQIVNPRTAIDYHDSQIARSVLAHFLNLDGGGGSYALADVQAQTFTDSLQTIAEDIADTANQFLVERMVNLGFDRDHGPYPRITFDPIGSKKELTAEAMAALINAGLFIPDADLEAEWRRRYGLPPKKPLSQAKKDNPNLGKPDPAELKTLVDAMAVLVEKGFTTEQALAAVGLNPIAPAGVPPDGLPPGAPPPTQEVHRE